MKTNITLFLVLLSIFGLNAQSKKQTPNIIFIEADDLMPRFMNKLGEGFGHTPNLDKLATRGVHFPHAVAQGPMCGPSRNSLITGLYPHNLGFYKNGDMRFLPENIWTFPKVFQANGYETAYVGKSHVRPQERKQSKADALKQYGFDFVNASGERHAIWRDLKKGKDVSDIPFIKHLKARGKYEQFLKDNDVPGHKMRSTMQDDADYLDGYMTHIATDWIENKQNQSKPFFMWFNFCLPHGPYDVPQRYFDIAEKIEIPGPKTDSFGHPVPEPLLTGNKPADPKKIPKERLGEVANVAFMDKMIGKLITSLEASGELENTVIVFFSDHSIFLGNHGRSHKSTLFEETLNTSMIISYPKLFPQDKINMQPMELLDLIPTAFEMAGIENPNQIVKNGASIVPILTGKKESVRSYAFSEIYGAQSATGERYRYITSEGYEILYDRINDPYEMKNIAEEQPEITKKMREAVKDWMANSGSVLEPKTH